MRFADASHGWAVGRSSDSKGQHTAVILATTDGGTTWTEQKSLTKAILSSVAFVDTDDGWAVGQTIQRHGLEVSTASLILHTSDGGAQWRVEKTGTKVGLYSVAFVDADDGWAVGFTLYRRMAGIILHTSDGGVSWTEQKSGTKGFLLDGVAFADASHGWAVGDLGVLATSDGGITWTRQSPGTMDVLSAVSFADASHGWVVGVGGAILATSTGGAAARTAPHGR